MSVMESEVITDHVLRCNARRERAQRELNPVKRKQIFTVLMAK
jgi:hypothetical protein